jgi:hypothetical protein
MSILQAGGQISSIRVLDGIKLTPVKISEADEQTYQRLIGVQQAMLEHRYGQAPDLSNNPAYKPYATVRVGGKIMAEIDNNGFVTSSNAIGARIRDALAAAGEAGEGPNLAQARAELIAELLGGAVEKASTALTQAQFRTIPKPSVTIDYEAMRQDPLYEQLRRTRQARTLFLAQQMAQS